MAQSSAHGNMDIQDQKATFHGFLMASVWSGGLIAQLVALLTLAFAIGDGWWPGLAAFVAIGAALGLAFRLSGVYWAVQVALWVLLGIGGVISMAMAG
ncbi:MAG: aa3-type cytochrome c oxidase subunit IV [Hyphomonadaceae bacterium]|nr:aa3-type cytochrome c oxidase subunit IV [Hyphomonadaceae bacterium]MCA8886219.1 aa3-type cytochrome c oxidase subunit IV [Hyphomonadaceae bacterium]